MIRKMNPAISLVFLLQGLSLFASSTASYGGNQQGGPMKRGHELPMDNLLSYGYYRESCPEFETIVGMKVKNWTKNDYSLGPSLLRLVFHDCAATGCDGSILLDYNGTERRSPASRTLRGFEVIDDIKAELEKTCPETVSCADILVAASRAATNILGGPRWTNAYGRKDATASYARDAEKVPSGRRDVTGLLEIFQSYGLNVVDLVVLSGAHTIGRASCGTIQSRLYNFDASGKPDPSLDGQYENYLRRKCQSPSEYVDLDAVTPKKFDNQYYKNLKEHKGLLTTDQELIRDPRTAPLVTVFADQPSEIFERQFGVSMWKLVNVGVITDEDRDGEIRKVCSKTNSNPY